MEETSAEARFAVRDRRPLIEASGLTHRIADRVVLAARVLIAVLAATGVVAGLAVARLDIVLVCVLTLVAVEALFRRSA